MSERITKVNDLLRDLVAKALLTELSLKQGVLLTVAKVDTSKDLRHARVFVSVFPESEENYVKATLKKELSRLEKNVHDNLYMKPLPRLLFTIDVTEQGADVVEKIILSEDF